MTRAEESYLKMSPEIKEAIEATFNIHGHKLPSRDVFTAMLGEPGESSLGKMDSFMSSFAMRDLYLKHCFVVYTHEMMVALKEFCYSKRMKVVHELCCGTGWMSHWMKRYGIPLKEAVDNKSWGHYKTANNFLPIVKKHDAVKFVKNNQDADMFILSWPYMDPLAHNIWMAMRPGQYLLYIGEGPGGCTADDGFFESTADHQIFFDEAFNKVTKSFVQFAGLHDMPELYLKK